MQSIIKQGYIDFSLSLSLSLFLLFLFLFSITIMRRQKLLLRQDWKS